MPNPQTFKNHARFDPAFHFLLVPLNGILLIGAVRWLLQHGGEFRAGPLLVSVILFALTFKTRIYALHNQDRIIRLEEQVRLHRLMPGEAAVLDALTIDQCIGLRFASDAEAPALARRAATEGLNRKAIKSAIVAWRADEFRI